jgi:hypothetical protein
MCVCMYVCMCACVHVRSLRMCVFLYVFKFNIINQLADFHDTCYE